MPSTLELGNLSEQEWSQLQSQAQRLEEAWKSGESVDLKEFLPPRNDPRRLIHLRELIKTELEIRYQRGQRVTLEYYTKLFPELGPTRDLPLSLICEEYRVRQLHGDKPTLAEYQRRFPPRAQELPERLREHQGQAAVQPSHAFASEESNFLLAGENYRKIRLLASGSFADVWQGEAPGKLPVAIKVIRQSIEHSAGRREHEALERTIGLRHPFLVQMHAYWMDQEHQLHIVMELGDKTLHQRLNECKSDGVEGIPKEELIKYFRQVADALDYLHRPPKGSLHKPMVHQDVKPANIILFQGNAKLADFGLAEILPDAMRTIAGQGEGTAVYMAPDAFKREVHPNNDQYSLAATYVHLRLGRVLFPDLTYFGQMQAHLNQQPNLDPLPEVEQRVLLKALHKDRKQRFGSCSEFTTALEEALLPSTRNRSRSNKPILDHRIGPASRGDIHQGFLPDERIAAITVIHDLKPGELREMVRAAKLLKTIDHENLVKVYDYWQIDRNGSLVSEEANDSAIIVGKVTLEIATELFTETLEQRLEKSLKVNRRGLEAKEVISYLKQAAEALDFLNHRRTYPGEELSIQHCGLGPHCFYLNGDQLKLGDYSLVKVLRGDSVTLDNSDLDPGWCAPEVFENPPLVVRQSDQYRLAISYYLLRTGKLPFDKRRPHKVLDEGLDLSGLEDPEREVLARATAVRPQDRFPNCRVLMRALEKACARRTAPAKPRPAPAAEAPKPESKVERAPEAPPTSRSELGTVAPPPQPPDASPPTSRPVLRTTAVPPQPPPAPPAPPSREARPAAVLPPQLPEASPPSANPEAFVPGGSLRPVPKENARKERAPLNAEAPVDEAAPLPAPSEVAEDLGIGLQDSIWTQRPSLFETERRDHDKHIPAGLIETGPPPEKPPAPAQAQESTQGWRDEAVVDVERKPSLRFPRPGKKFLAAVALVLVVGTPLIILFGPDSVFGRTRDVLKPILVAVGWIKPPPGPTPPPKPSEVEPGPPQPVLPGPNASQPGLDHVRRQLDQGEQELKWHDEALDVSYLPRAEKSFAAVPQAEEIPRDLRIRAKLGLARVFARQGNMTVAQAHLQDLEQLLKYPGIDQLLQERGVKLGNKYALEALIKQDLKGWLVVPRSSKESEGSWELEQLKTLLRDTQQDVMNFLTNEENLDQATLIAESIRTLDSNNQEANSQLKQIQLIKQLNGMQKDNKIANEVDRLLAEKRLPKRAAAICEAYVAWALAQKDPPNRKVAIESVKDAYGRLDKQQDKDRVRSPYHALLTREIEYQIPRLERRVQFATTLKYCQEVNTDKPNNRVLACLAECQLEAGGDRGKALSELRKRLEDGNRSGRDTYCQYVLGLLYEEERDRNKAIEFLDLSQLANSTAKSDWKWINSGRRKRGALIYAAAAEALANSQANGAFEWYEKALKLYPEEDATKDDYRLGLAEVALAKKPHDAKRAEQEIAELLVKRLINREEHGKAYRALRIRARARTEIHQLAGALNDYAVIGNLYHSPKKQLELEPKRFLEEVLDPAIAAGTGWVTSSPKEAENRGKLLGQFFGLKGRLLLDNLYGSGLPPEKNSGDRIKDALAAYTAASENHPRDQTWANYVMWQAYLLTWIQPVDLERIRMLAERAAKTAPNYSGCWFIKAIERHLRAAENLSNNEEVTKLEREAVDSLNEAIRLSKSEIPDPQLAHLDDQYHSYRSAAHVVLANQSKTRNNLDECRALLKEAQKDADFIIKEGTSRFLWHAHLQQGHAWEDLAELENDRSVKSQLYDRALEALELSALKSGRQKPDPIIAAGRVYYKRFTEGGERDRASLKEASNRLGEACAIAKVLKDKRQEVEAHVWLGQVLLEQEDFKATDEIKVAIGLADPEWLRYVRDTVIPKELKKAAELAKRRAEGALTLAKAVREQCELLRPNSSGQRKQIVNQMLESYYLEVRLHEQRKEPEAATKACKEAKALLDKELADPPENKYDHVDLLLNRSNLILIREQDLLSDDLKRKPSPQCMDDADEAIRLAEEHDLPKSVRARAWYLAGLSREYKYPRSGKSDENAWREILSKFEEAIKLDGKNKNSFVWRYHAGMACWQIAAKRDAAMEADSQKWFDRARGYFGQVIKDPESENSPFRARAQQNLDTLSPKAR